MKKINNSVLIILSCLLCLKTMSQAKSYAVSSPDKSIIATFFMGEKRQAFFTVTKNKEKVLAPSSLGLITDFSDFASGLTLVSASPITMVTDSYKTMNAKKSNIVYKARKGIFHLKNKKGNLLDIIFQVSNDGVAFRYLLPGKSKLITAVTNEATAYQLMPGTRGWLQPMASSKSGWEATNPSYEENYLQDVPVGTPSPIGAGWVYPSLFKTGNNWLLFTEAAMDGSYCATRLNCDSGSSTYKVAFPDPREVITGKALLPQITLSAYSPWRIITVGDLATITESTLGTDLAKPAIKLDAAYVKPGKSAWSWIMSKDDFIIFEEQKKYIDFASDMHWQYCLVDVNWDQKIGFEKIAELVAYAATKKVGLLLWYNSAGDWNTVKYTPKDKLLTSELRQAEFARLQSMGIKGVKIDFFAGDGQSVIQYYIDILEDAAKYNLLVNFHGATLPRGWARTYPNLVTTEAVKGFEMITFEQVNADKEANHCAMLPFTRNAFDPMDFTPMNLYKIASQVQRKTTSAFELATSVLFLSGIQHFAENAEGMSHMPAYVKTFLQTLPDYWDDVKFVDGFPGKLAVIARRKGDTWYIAGINGENAGKKLLLNLAWLKNRNGSIYQDGETPLSIDMGKVTIKEDGQLPVNLSPNGGFVMTFK
ncbi:MAG: glycoside hydrolase family 97 catalytic domain-containing protein [Bacteroidota bacterium]